MPCNRPLPAWRTKAPLPSGRHGVVFNVREADTSRKLEIPCGRCTGCRLERARQWAIRILHEAKRHEHSWFVTLTYDDASLPSTVQGLPTLQPEDFVLFMKRLRRNIERRVGASAPSPPKLRYYQCGEYGEQTNRPHHHAIIFGLYLPDLRQLNNTRAKNAHTLYTSAELEKTWNKGIISIGRVTFETAAYVAAYVTKKITGPQAREHYQGRTPEYSTMSRRPGIGSGFAAEYEQEIYEADSVIIRGLEMKPPKYYDRQLERRDPERWYEIKDRRTTEQKHIAAPRERAARELTAYQNLRKRDAT